MMMPMITPFTKSQGMIWNFSINVANGITPTKKNKDIVLAI